MSSSNSRIVPIDSANPDFFQWGANCANLGYDEQVTQRIVDTFYGEDHEYEVAQLDQFWTGYNSVHFEAAA